MIRIVGILLIAGGMVGTGILYAVALRGELRRLEGFLRLMRRIRSRIACFREPLPTVYADFEDEALSACGFLTVLRRKDFTTALNQTKETLGLRASVFSLLFEFGSQLGKSHAEDQLRLCDHYIGQMEETITALRDKNHESIRLSRALSLALAAMVIILLW